MYFTNTKVYLPNGGFVVSKRLPLSFAGSESAPQAVVMTSHSLPVSQRQFAARDVNVGYQKYIILNYIQHNTFLLLLLLLLLFILLISVYIITTIIRTPKIFNHNKNILFYLILEKTEK
jgi:hypothetical protein